MPGRPGDPPESWPGTENDDSRGPNTPPTVNGGSSGIIDKTVLYLLITILGAIAAGIGTTIAKDLQRQQPLMFTVLGVIAAGAGVFYFIRSRRRRSASVTANEAQGAGQAPPGRSAPAPARILPSAGENPTTADPAGHEPSGGGGRVLRTLRGARFSAAWPRLAILIVGTCLLVAAAFLAGYWTFGTAFAIGLWAGLGSILIAFTVIVASAVIGTRHRRADWLTMIHPGSRTATAFVVAVLGLSAGGTLGSLNMTHTAACPAPTELRVLTSWENLLAVQAAIPVFEQGEAAYLHQSCYAVDLTAYAAPSDAAAEQGLDGNWNTSVNGPRPDIWIPASTVDVSVVRAALAAANRSVPQLGPPRSVGSSPVVIAVPTALASQYSLNDAGHFGSWADVYRTLARDKIGLDLPDPRKSDSGQLGIAALYPGLSTQDVRAIEAPGSFKPDSDAVLCAAAQQQETVQNPPPTAFLVSGTAVGLNNSRQLGQLTEGACPTLSRPPPTLHVLYSAPDALDFPFTTVSWTAPATVTQVRNRYENDFYHWLVSPAGRAKLEQSGLGQPTRANLLLEKAVKSALTSFNTAQAPSYLLVGIDDSGPMRSTYLPQIEAALPAVLGPGTSELGARDSFGIWTFPGAGKTTYQQLLPFGQAKDGQKAKVQGAMSGLNAHWHSAEFDLIWEAAPFLLYHTPRSNPPAIRSVVLLTDGDGFQPADPGGHSFANLTNAVSLPNTPTTQGVKVFVIAFGAQGCAQAPELGASLAAVASLTDGYCVPANGPDNTRQDLSQMISGTGSGG